MDATQWILILAVIAAGIYFLRTQIQETFVSMDDIKAEMDDAEYNEEEEDAEYEEEEEEDAEEYDEEDEEDAEEYDDEMYEPAEGDYMSQGGVSTRLMSSSQSGQEDDFTEFAPRLTDQNFLEGKRFIGLDTKGSTLRNPSLDLRGNIPVQKIDVPWLNSTIEADTRPGI
jgi:hypothetical protein